MASTFFAQFCGGFYKALSPSVAADQAINVFTETTQVQGNAKQTTIYGAPGRVLETTLATLPNRGWFTQDGRTWTVSGDTLYERTAPATYVSRGTVSNDGSPVSFSSNGKGGDQLGLVSGGEIYMLDLVTDVLTGPVVLPFMNPVLMAFIDGYFIVNQANTPIQWFSALEDGTSWDALDFFTRSGTSDNTVGIAVSRDRIWVLGSKTSTQFYDSGDVDTPFLPYPGTTFQTGLVSPYLLTLYNDILVWVAESARGQRRVVAASEPSPQTISTPPIEIWLGTATTLSDARILAYEQEGHAFVPIITAPSTTGDIKTYAFDMTEKQWAARSKWDAVNGVHRQWPASGSTTTAGTVLVGDYQTGEVFTLELDAYDDDGGILMAERTAPYLSTGNQWLFVNGVELAMQPGVGLSSGQGSDPQVELSISRDGAHTWVSAGFGSLGAIGNYVARAIWKKIGRAREDRLVLRVRQSDPVKRVWQGLWLDFDRGTGQL